MSPLLECQHYIQSYSKDRDLHDPERANRCRNVHTREGGDARAAGVEHVVLALELVYLAAEGEGHLWEAGDRVAVDGVLAIP